MSGYAGKLRGRLSEVYSEDPARHQGPVPAHLLPGRQVSSRKEFRASALVAKVAHEIASAAAKVSIIPADHPARVLEEAPAAVATLPSETTLQRLSRLRREYEARHPIGSPGADRRERERVQKRAYEAKRRARRAAGDLEKLKPGARVEIPQPPCPNGCPAEPERRGKRRGRNRWHCPTCLRNWQA